MCNTDAHACVFIACSADADCSPGSFCHPDFRDCRADCEDDRQCAPGTACRGARCVPVTGTEEGAAASSFSSSASAAAPRATFSLDSLIVGEEPSHTLTLELPAGTLAAHQMVWAYPDSFGFRGFDVRGLDMIGRLSLELNAEGAAPVVVQMKALSREKAFLDVDDSGFYTPGLDPLLVRRLPDASVFVLVLPAGGDGDKSTLALPLAARATFSLDSGILSNPLVPGPYAVSVAVETVDPDTGDADDGVGPSPERRVFEQTLSIVPLGVAIDVKPRSSSNNINVRNHGVVRVAILTTDGFDAKSVDVASVEFGPGKARQARAFGRLDDVDGDGDRDLVLHFETRETGIVCGVTSATLTGATSSGRVFEGVDSIRTVGCPKPPKPPKPSKPGKEKP